MNCWIGGLIITGFSGAGIRLLPDPAVDHGAIGDVLWGNQVGVGSANGVGIAVSSSNNVIGGNVGNLIQGNITAGIMLSGTAGTGLGMIMGGGMAMQARPGRVQSHVRLIAILWLALSAFNTVAAVILYVLANTLLAHVGNYGAPEEVGGFLRPLLSVVAIVLLAKAAIGFITGWGLLQHQKWARIVILVLGFFSLFTNIPFGTALGIYTLWVLLPSESEREYDALTEAQVA